LKRAVEHFRQALSLDPGYVLAYAGLADVYTIQGVMGARPPHEVGPPALEAALHALSIDEHLPAAHYALGHALVQYDRDWSGAEVAYKRAIELDPHCTDAHHRYAILLMTSARPQEAFAQIRRARELDPTSLPIDVTEGFLHYWNRQYAKAIEHLRGTLEREPNFWMAHYWLAQVCACVGDDITAAASAQRADELLGNHGAAWLLAWVDAVAGRREQAITKLELLLRRAAEQFVPSHDIAQVYAGLGDAEQLFAWLARAEQERSRHLDTLGVNPVMDAYRNDPRMLALQERIGIKPSTFAQAQQPTQV
jgi:tetratricopeptide (TPR) repeat protein